MTHDTQPFQPTGASYSPGGWVALAAGRQWLLLRLAPADPMVQQCWTAMSAGGSVEDVLGPLFAAGLAAIPDFALVVALDSGCRAVLRGMAQVHYGPTIVTAGTSLLLDRMLADIPADAEVLLTGGDAADTSLQLPLSAGVSMAGSIRLVTGQPPVVPGRLGTASQPELPTGPPAVTLVKKEFSNQPSVADPGSMPATSTAGSDSTPAVEPVTAAVTGPVTEPEPPSGEFDHLFAATVHPAELKQLRDELEAETELEAEQDLPRPAIEQPAPATSTIRTPPEAPVPQRPAIFHTQQWATRPPYEDAGLIDSVPWMTGESTPEPARNEPVTATGPAPQLTVKRSSLAAMVTGAATVPAAFCPDGHPNPPHAARCRSCDRPVAEQESVEIARPVLGVLRLSTGEAVSLDRGVLIGREPSDPDPTGIDRPHVLRLPDDPQVSRNHVEVSIDGWRVHVADLGSTNGTFVTPARQPTMRLNERDPQLIEPGTEVRLSDDFSFSYEVGQ